MKRFLLVLTFILLICGSLFYAISLPHNMSGLFYRATLGQDGLIMGGAITRRLLFAFVIGILIAMSMYHAILFLYRRGEKVYFALTIKGKFQRSVYAAIFAIAAIDVIFDLPPNLFLTLSQCVMLAVNYAETRRRETELAARTDFYHQMAHDLLTPLTIISTNVQVAAAKPEKAPDKLKDSQAEIMKMAGMINAALKGGDGK